MTSTTKRSIFGYFFFSSRRRHTRSYGDWSSDVCSSDLLVESDLAAVGRGAQGIGLDLHHRDLARCRDRCGAATHAAGEIENLAEAAPRLDEIGRASCRERG